MRRPRAAVAAATIALASSALSIRPATSQTDTGPPPFIADVVGINGRGEMLAFVQKTRSDRGFYRIDWNAKLTETPLLDPEPDWAQLRDGFWNVPTPEGPNEVGDVLVKSFRSGTAELRAADGSTVALPHGLPASFGPRSHVAYVSGAVDYPPTDITVYDRQGRQLWHATSGRPALLWSPVELNGTGGAAFTSGVPLDPEFNRVRRLPQPGDGVGTGRSAASGSVPRCGDLGHHRLRQGARHRLPGG
jgi:hypothetical protein